MKEFKDLTGLKYGYFTVLNIKENSKRGRSWLCECVCGNKLILPESHVLGTSTRPRRSCGCMQLKQKGYSQTEPKLYGLWQQMIGRCHSKRNNIYYKYGAKGITVCDEWRENFESFLIWAKENGYEEGLTLDRIEESKGYSPSNCRWVDYYIQEANKGIKETNTTGYTGVCPHGKYFVAYISRGGIRKNLGLFKKVEDAARARQDAEIYFETHGSLPE